VLDFGLQLIGYEKSCKCPEAPFEKADAQPVRRATSGSAMLLHLLDGVTAGGEYVSSRLCFGASPHQVFEDEDDDEDEYD
jgi:hypothetical protein